MPDSFFNPEGCCFLSSHTSGENLLEISYTYWTIYNRILGNGDFYLSAKLICLAINIKIIGTSARQGMNHTAFSLQ